MAHESFKKMIFILFCSYVYLNSQRIETGFLTKIDREKIMPYRELPEQSNQL